MNIVATARNSKHLADTAERTSLELASNGVPPRPAEVRAGAGIPSRNSRLWNDADFSEMDQSESLYFERRWRWPLSYRSIEGLAIFRIDERARNRLTRECPQFRTYEQRPSQLGRAGL